MCLNCGCGLPNDDMGDKRNLTLNKDLAEALKANPGQTGEQMLDELNKSLAKLKGEDIDKATEKLDSQTA